MIQRTDGFGFTLESLAELRGGNLDRDITTDAGIILLVRAKFSPSESRFCLNDGVSGNYPL